MPLRSKIVTAVLALLFLGWGISIVLRTRTPHQSPALPAPVASIATSASAPASASAPPPPSSSAVVATTSASATLTDAGAPKNASRPLRVVALGWELVASDIAANAGDAPAVTNPLTQAGTSVRPTATESMDRLEAALARGGDDPDGADVAVLPMSSFVASYERLRALDPQIFLITAYSRGRDALVGAKDALPPLDKGVSVVGTLGDPASFLALATLDLAGAPAGSVRFVAPSSTAEEAPLAAIDRDATTTDAARPKIVLTSADATHLLPIVAVAPRDYIAQHTAQLMTWAKTRAASTATSATLAGLKNAASGPNPPNALVILRRLGLLAPATFADNARFLGLTGRSSIDAAKLFGRAWSLFRAAGVLATPAPETAPIATTVLAAITKESPALLEPASPAKVDAPANTDALRVLFTLGKLEPDATTAIGFAMEAFSRSPVRVAVPVKNGSSVDVTATKAMLRDLTDKIDAPASRLVVAKKLATKPGTSVEILAAP